MPIRCEQIQNAVIQEYCDHLRHKGTFLSSEEEARRSFTSQVYRDEIQRGFDYLQKLRKREYGAALTTTPFSFVNTAQSSTPWKTFPGLFDDQLLKDSVQQVNRLTDSLKKRGLKENSPKYDRALFHALIDFFRSPRGWGLKPSPDLTPINPREVYESRTASCFPFVHPFLVFAKLAKLDAFPVEVYRGEDKTWKHHVEVAVRFHRGTHREEILFVNLEEARPVYRSHKDWKEISYDDLVALAYNNWAVSPTLFYQATQTVPRNLLEDQIEKFEEGLRYSRHYLILSNYAACLFNLGGEKNIAKALKLFEEAQTLNPDFFKESVAGQLITHKYDEEKNKSPLLSSN